jgi:hypothetical protein
MWQASPTDTRHQLLVELPSRLAAAILPPSAVGARRSGDRGQPPGDPGRRGTKPLVRRPFPCRPLLSWVEDRAPAKGPSPTNDKKRTNEANSPFVFNRGPESEPNSDAHPGAAPNDYSAGRRSDIGEQASQQVR